MSPVRVPRRPLVARLVRTLALSLLAAAILASPFVQAVEGDPSKAGAYCKLPAPGEKPVCLAPAQAQYEDFFASIDDGLPSAASAARVEADLDAGDSNAYLALSSLSYGYWQLARRAAKNQQVDPVLAERLAAWNELLSSAYADDAKDPAFRLAVREAALDLDARTPIDGFRCHDESGDVTTCRPAAALVSRIEGLDEQLGVRGAIRRVLERLFPEES